MTSQILCEFYAIVTNARSQAAIFLRCTGRDFKLLGFLRVLPVPVTTIDEVMSLLRRRPVTGGEIFDLQIVATMKLNGISHIYTFNTDDFKAFSELQVLTP